MNVRPNWRCPAHGVELTAVEVVEGGRIGAGDSMVARADPESPYCRDGGIFGDFDRPVVTFCDGGGNSPQ